MRTLIFGSLVGMPLLAGVTLYVQVTFSPLVAPRLIIPWLATAWGDLAVWSAAIIALVLLRPGRGQVERYWTPFGRRLVDVWSLLVVTGVWVFMPPSGPELRLLMTVLCMSYIIVTMLGGAETAHSPDLAIVAVLASLAAFFLSIHQPYGLALAVFLAWYGITALILRRFIQRALSQAREGRAASEAALRLTAAERDARTSFIRAASHDLQQPIQAASLYVEQALTADDPQDRQIATLGARNAFASTQALLETMLDHLRLEAGAMPVRLADTPVGSLFARVVEAHAPAAQAAGMRLKALPTGLKVVADPELAVRALGNLVGNAVKHARGERILLAARRRGDGQVDLWVLDDGEGVYGGIEGLFEDFSQGADVEERGGFGLGLSSVRRFSGLMGGRAGHEPGWRNGAAFFVRLKEAECASA